DEHVAVRYTTGFPGDPCRPRSPPRVKRHPLRAAWTLLSSLWFFHQRSEYSTVSARHNTWTRLVPRARDSVQRMDQRPPHAVLVHFEPLSSGQIGGNPCEGLAPGGRPHPMYLMRHSNSLGGHPVAEGPRPLMAQRTRATLKPRRDG